MFCLLKLVALSCIFSTACFAAFSAKELTLEEKVGQLLVAHFHGEEANEEARVLIQEAHVGGIIYYTWANGLHSPKQVKQLSLGLQKLAEANHLAVPGGVVARPTKEFTIFPGNMALGMTGNPKLAQEAALAMGKELRAVGINMNLAPVVDVNSNPRNPIIGIRSFGTSPISVAQFAEHALQGYHEAGIITSLKHFPGHGDIDTDSHEDLPIIRKSKEELEEIELFPFRKLASKTDTITTAHLLVPALDPDYCSTLSKKTIYLLKNEMQFKGVIISDSLAMKGVLKNSPSIDEAVIQSFNAGCDLLCFGGRQLNGTDIALELTPSDIKRIHVKLVEAVKEGRIAEARLTEAVEKVLKLKEYYLFSSPPELSLQIINALEHQEIAKKIASLSLRVTKNNPSLLYSLKEKKVAIIAPELIQEAMEKSSLPHLGKETSLIFFKSLTPSEKEREDILREAKKADIILICSYNSWKYSSQAALIHSLLAEKRLAILLAVRDPLDTSLFQEALHVMATYSPTLPSLQAAYERLSFNPGSIKSDFVKSDVEYQ
ncbi:MAG: glycoside hydrolase family 3 protein [Simkania negevensis]|nr:glycoside hydrolase family 3 protein [Simkania negevensis]